VITSGGNRNPANVESATEGTTQRAALINQAWQPLPHPRTQQTQSVSSPSLMCRSAVIVGELFGILSDIVAKRLCRGREPQLSQEMTA
jgi:hypothetical protein